VRASKERPDQPAERWATLQSDAEASRTRLKFCWRQRDYSFNVAARGHKALSVFPRALAHDGVQRAMCPSESECPGATCSFGWRSVREETVPPQRRCNRSVQKARSFTTVSLCFLEEFGAARSWLARRSPSRFTFGARGEFEARLAREPFIGVGVQLHQLALA